jgi:L,D-transpeptidase YcbB
LHLRTSARALAIALLVGAAACTSGGGQEAAAPPGVTAEALQSAVQDESARRFYEARQWRPAWAGEAETELVGVLRGAAAHGLDPATFLRDVPEGGDPVAREAALTRAALAYAEALARGRTDPGRLFEVYTLARPEADVAGGLARAVEDGNVGAWIAGLAPQDEEYRALSQAYQQAIQAQQQPAQPQGGQAGNQAQGNSQQAAPAAPSAMEQAVQLAVNLERRRWLAREAPATRIDVNTAGTFLTYYRDGAVADQRVVVVGEPGWETPQLGSPIFRLVANPDWTVPESIEQDELADLSPAQLARRNMSREDGRLVQQPGPDNALGQVKFDMQNEHAIYLHDTPAKALFGQPQRHRSHGCVRVQDALGFARLLAEHDGKLDAFNRALATQDTQMVQLSREIPVRLLYHTAYVENGRVTVRPDPYGWDNQVARALGFDVAALERAQRRRGGEDVGP